ncbi:hypothetical protein ABIA69_004755 [Lysinibacillus parviboronicapiens]|uniref:Uncharacterized protein n=1 Tax=Lysinibacillus parviboronicapiens TaxID=436516 RepID=A0ABV2PRE4_9BACI
MTKILRFKKKTNITDFEGLSVNGGAFKEGDGFIQKNTIVMDVPDTFRFSTKIEVYSNGEGICDLIMSQFLTRGPELWEMGDAFYRIGFNDEGNTEQQLRNLCDELINRGLVDWVN